MRMDEVIKVVGTMSGTSLDGVDAAVIETDGRSITGFGKTDYRAYSLDERAVLKASLGLWPEDNVLAAKQVVEKAHKDILTTFTDVDMIGFHGQTLAHDPGQGRTHQIGDGAWLANQLGRPVVWDFRTADVVAGGQGAPLAPFFHFACAKWIGATQPLVFLNLGGVGNLTWVDPGKDDPAQQGALLAFDTGPANAPINDFMQQRYGLAFDKDGELAQKGHVDQASVDAFMSHPYFTITPPKSLDRNDFPDILDRILHLSDADAVATLCGFVVASVSHSITQMPVAPQRVLVTGGGRHNRVLMAGLSNALKCPVAPVEDVGLNGDMLEAQAFGYLAVRVAKSLPITCPSTTGVAHAISGGILSAP
ncbi:anhydro-N-acetylmuramic acid kinase [Parasulfitobacter algicola]|uniref:Anhydro-N-acetylmuramic acid kinase n=1 Tax=Parasulfitobacter algicola TaxID=2614809 RepID=A0ABX2IQH7_9RHOB|nr:anhydro-N-acetylmuramic acid kinase [Sulfitobacter algicola]NSX55139.1 anhydro-N-acetylmuramic acid kinase [Sulfitobacter algicola]